MVSPLYVSVSECCSYKAAEQSRQLRFSNKAPGRRLNKFPEASSSSQQQLLRVFVSHKPVDDITSHISSKL